MLSPQSLRDWYELLNSQLMIWSILHLGRVLTLASLAKLSIWLLLLLEIARESWIIRVWPRRARSLEFNGQAEKARQTWGNLAHAPLPLAFFSTIKSQAHQNLARLFLAAQRPEDALEHLNWLLKFEAKTPHQEVEIRREIAGCYDLLKRPVAAAKERAAATKILENLNAAVPDEVRGLDTVISQSRNCCDNLQFAAAIPLLEKALLLSQNRLEWTKKGRSNWTPADALNAHCEILNQLALARYQCDDGAGALEAAQQAIENGDARFVTPQLAHGLAAAAWLDLGRLDEAQFHREREWELALQSGEPSRLAEARVHLAELDYRRGNLEKAVGELKAVLENPAGAERIAWANLFGCHFALGELEAARESLERFKTGAWPNAQAEVFAKACANLDRAWLELELGDPKLSWDLARNSVPLLQSHPRIGPRSQATQAWIYAVHEREDAARQIIAELETTEFASVATRKSVWSNLALAFRALGEPENARQNWLEYLELAPDPLQLPRAYFYLGELCEELDDLSAARQWREKAVETGIETFLTQKAREKLGFSRSFS